jgi:hypothetical protein
VGFSYRLLVCVYSELATEQSSRQNLETWHASLDCNHTRERKRKKLTRLRVSFPSVQRKQRSSPLLSKRSSFRKNLSD